MDEMKCIIATQFQVIISNFKMWCSREAFDASKQYNWQWMILSPNEWMCILDSILLVSHDVLFVETFGKEIMIIKQARGLCENFMHQGTNCCFLCSSVLQPQPGDTTLFQLAGYKCQKCQFTFLYDCKYTHCPYHTATLLDSSSYCSACDLHYRRRGLEEQTWMSNNQWKYDNGRFEGGSDEVYSVLTIPNSLSNPNHFGHLVWKYSQVARLVENGSKRIVVSGNGQSSLGCLLT
jgi:hypothetical protein